MMIPPHLAPDMTVAVALAEWPALTAVFVRRGMACPGCLMADFMTLGEAAEVYGLKAEALLEELRTASGCGPAPSQR